VRILPPSAAADRAFPGRLAEPLGQNCRPVLSFEFGGGPIYENHVVGFWGDFVACITTGSNVGSTGFGTM